MLRFEFAVARVALLRHHCTAVAVVHKRACLLCAPRLGDGVSVAPLRGGRGGASPSLATVYSLCPVTAFSSALPLPPCPRRLFIPPHCSMWPVALPPWAWRHLLTHLADA